VTGNLCLQFNVKIQFIRINVKWTWKCRKVLS